MHPLLPGGPLALFVACLVSGLLVPLPEDVALLVAGWEIRKGALDPIAAGLAGLMGVLGRDVIAFSLGRVLGPRIEGLPWVRRILGEHRLERSHALWERWGARMLFLTRFAVGMRAPLYFVGGALGYPASRFVGLDLAGLVLTVPLTLWAGWRFGPGAAEALTSALAHQRVLLALLVVSCLGWLLLRMGRREA